MKCALDECRRDAVGKLFCQRHFYLLLPPMQKTILFLWNHGLHRSGFDEVLANAVMQISDRERRDPFDPFIAIKHRKRRNAKT